MTSLSTYWTPFYVARRILTEFRAVLSSSEHVIGSRFKTSRFIPSVNYFGYNYITVMHGMDQQELNSPTAMDK